MSIFNILLDIIRTLERLYYGISKHLSKNQSILICDYPVASSWKIYYTITPYRTSLSINMNRSSIIKTIIESNNTTNKVVNNSFIHLILQITGTKYDNNFFN